MKRMKFAMILLATGSSFLAACSSGSEAGTGSGGEDLPGVRSVEVSALDSLRFDPAEILVQSGEMVRFLVTNEGSGEHEFILGDEATQMEHEGEMGMGASMEHEGMDLPALSLQPGETQEVTVTFDRAGTILYGCHVPGHYAAGMVGALTVT